MPSYNIFAERHPHSSLEEHEIIHGLKSGDEKAFKHLVKTYKDRVFNTALGFLRNKENAEDLAQEVFIEIFMSVHQFENRSKLSTWIYRITVTKSLEFIRRSKRKKRFAPLLRLIGPGTENGGSFPDYHHPSVDLENRELGEQIFRALDTLPENQRIAFTLHKIEDLSYQEIAEVMKTSLSAVESLIHRARKTLKQKLDHLDKH